MFRHGRKIFAVLAVFSFWIFVVSCGVTKSPSISANRPTVRVIPIDLDPERPAQTTHGNPSFLRGFELESDDPRFGGFSGLSLSAAGDHLYVVSDRGYWLSVRLRHDDAGRLLAFENWQLGPLLTPEGEPVSGLLTDAEGLARDQDGSLIVSFEQVHRLWRYSPPPAAFRSPARPLPVPAELANAPRNGGMEGVTVLPDGRILALTEEYKNPDGSAKGWLIDQDRFDALSYSVSDGFHVTDLAALAGGDVLVLERRHGLVGGWASRIRNVSGSALRPGALVKGDEILRLEFPLAVDNFEGMAVWEDSKLGTFIYLISDDNYRFFQRTLLLQFHLRLGGLN